MCVCVFSCSVISNSLQTHRLLCPWNFPGRNTVVGFHFLLQGFFPTQGSNLCLLLLLHWRQMLYLCATWEALNFAELLLNIYQHTTTCMTIWFLYWQPKRFFCPTPGSLTICLTYSLTLNKANLITAVILKGINLKVCNLQVFSFLPLSLVWILILKNQYKWKGSKKNNLTGRVKGLS